jgi:2-polyprenyl-3-methyl-5-hydroxy-6-metoxy-1,4-benzoquinol methylase
LGATTKVQAELAEIPKGCHLLDAVCGIGGPSWYLADSHGCLVEAIDLTPEFVEVARQLNEKDGLGDKITVEVGSVTELPCTGQNFDVVLSQNVSMNVAGKSAM